jgi:hypothetical protein
MVRVLSRGRESGNLGRYLERNPLINKDLQLGPVFPFKVPGAPTVAMGSEAGDFAIPAHTSNPIEASRLVVRT